MSEYVRCKYRPEDLRMSLDEGRLYLVAGRGPTKHDFRIVDNTGEAYVYLRSWFEPARPSPRPGRKAPSAGARSSKSTTKPRPRSKRR